MTPADLRSRGLSTPLADRMAATRPGQAAWAEPLLGKTCANCEHFLERRGGTSFDGTCDLFTRRTRRKVWFDGGHAKACMDWEEPK
jgi:hypothetical protein